MHEVVDKGGLRRAALTVVVAVAAGLASPAVAGDAGIEIQLHRDGFVLTAVDRASGEAGPSFPIAMGSPANPTPSGRFGVDRVILNPRWRPGESAVAAGVRELPPSLTSPMGVAKIPFAKKGEIALHGAGDALLLGKPVSSGCVRSDDGDLLRLVAWLHTRRALGDPRRTAAGEVHRRFRRPVRIVVR
ncbi:MAG: L,D-transpeptidase [Myxococcota bacterium]